MAGTLSNALACLVLRQTDVGEADRIVSLLCAERGRMEVRVPQARKSRKRFGGLDLFAFGEASFVAGRRLPTLREFAVQQGVGRLGGNLWATALASHCAAQILRCVPEGEGGETELRLALAALRALNVGAVEETSAFALAFVLAFDLKLLHVTGLRPALDRCVGCGATLSESDGPLAWSPRQGGLLIGPCASRDAAAQPVARGTLSCLNRLLRTPLAEVGRLGWSEAELEAAQGALEPLLIEQIGPPSKARRFLDSVLEARPGALPLLLLVGVLGVGCLPSTQADTVRIQGWLFDHWAPEEEAVPVAGASVSAWTDAGEIVGEAEEPFDTYPGYYRFDGLPPEAPVHLRFEPDLEQGLPTLISGRSAADDLFVDPGTFHLWSGETLADWDALWIGGMRFEDRATLEASAAPTGRIHGQVSDPESALAGRVVATDALGLEYSAWTQNSEGDAEYGGGLGAEGRFFFPTLSPGPYDLQFIDANSVRQDGVFRTLVVESSVTSLLGFRLEAKADGP